MLVVTAAIKRCLAGLVLAAMTVALVRSPGTAADPIVLRVGTLAADAAAEPFYAQDLGYFTAQGLDVQISVLPTGAAITAAIISGALDVGIATTAVAAIAHEKHIPVHLIAPAALYTGAPASSAILVAKDSDAKTGADLNGKTVAVIGLKDVSQFSTAAWIDKNGGDSKTVKFIEMPVGQMGLALTQHRIDAALIPEPFLNAARANAREIGNAQGAVGKHYMLLGWLAADPWIARNGPGVRAFAAAIRQAAAWGNKHPDESAAILLRYTKLSPDIAKTMTRSVYDPAPLSAALLQPLIDAAAKYGTLEKSFNAQELIATVPR